MKQRIYKMFKKSLLAAAISVVAINAGAASLAGSTANIALMGQEFIANEATGVALDTPIVTLGAQYSVGDIIKVQLSGASFDTVNSAPAAAFAAGTSGATMTLGLLSTSATEATFRVTVATGDHSNNGDATITFSALKMTTASASVAGAVTAVYSAETSTGVAIDTATTNTKVIQKGVTQYLAKFAATTDLLDAEIKVGALRANFGTAVYTDAVSVTFTDYAPLANEAWIGGLALQGAAPSATSSTLNGDFNFLDTNGDSAITALDAIFPAFVAVGTATAITPAANLQSITYAGPTAFTASGLTITAGNAAGDTVITDQSFTVDTSITYAPKTGGSVIATASMAAGAWGLDGANQDIAFLPFGSDYAQSITVSNDGTVSGAITVTIISEGNSYSETLTSVATAKTVTNISAEVAALAAASGVTGDAHINVIVNAPAGNIDVKGLYYHKPTQDRVLTK